jgi:hypothetical protein
MSDPITAAAIGAGISGGTSLLQGKKLGTSLRDAAIGGAMGGAGGYLGNAIKGMGAVGGASPGGIKLGSLGYDATQGSNSVAIGYNAATAVTTATFNTAVGNEALANLTTGNGYNTALGNLALNTLTTGQNNTGLGASSGRGITTGSNNVVVGSNDGDAGSPINQTGDGFIVLSDGLGAIGAYWDGTTKDQYTLGQITTGVQSTTAGALILANTNVGNFPTTIKSSNSATAAWTLTLPVNDGTSGQVLTTDGNGVTSWGIGAAPAPVWASIYDTSVSQTAAAINTAYVITLNSIDPDSDGISVVSGSRVTVASAGVYTFAPSIQLRNTVNAVHDFNLWFRKNGVNIANSASQFSVHGQRAGVDGYAVPAVVFTFKLAAND